MKAKLIKPEADKSWSLQFFEVPEDPVLRGSVWYWSEYFGKWWNVSPFKQGDYEDWIMIEYWSKSQSLILEAAMATCSKLEIELEI